jgi:Ser/Thr protein kinase RdoA (MazF antagonist)
MKYVNGKDIFPEELLSLIQEYTQGKYVYIPKRDEMKEKWGENTSYKKELEKRNNHIYTKYLTGFSIKQLKEKYHLSEKSINRIVVEKRKGTYNMKEQILDLLKLWNVQGDVKQIYNTTWQIGEQYVLKTNHDLGSLTRNIDIMKILDQHGIPVAKPIPTLDQQDYIESNGVYYLLMNKLPGTHIQDIFQVNFTSIAYETGIAVAKLHTAFVACEQKLSFWDNNFLDEVTGWIKQNLEERNYPFITAKDFHESLNDLVLCYENLPRQLIHRDMHYGNLLFDNGTFSGYIDFDLSQKNARIFDICYFILGLLSEHDKNEMDVVKWYSIITNFIKGYESLIILSNLEKDSICCLMENIELLFVAYFSSIEDKVLAESAAKLYYFVKQNKESIHNSIFSNDTAIK